MVISFKKYCVLDFQGDSLIDQSGTQTVAFTNTGSVTLGNKLGFGKGSAIFNASNNLSIANGNLTNLNVGTSDFAIEVIINVTNTGTTKAFVDTKDGAATGTAGYNFGLTAANLYILRAKGTSTAYRSLPFTSTYTYNNQIKHILLVCDRSGNASIYENGILLENISISSYSAEVWNPESSLMLGNIASGGYGINGSMYRARIWIFGLNVLTSAMITNLVNETFSEFTQAKQVGNIVRTIKNFNYPDVESVGDNGLIAYWNMNKSGSTLPDVSNNGRDATISGNLFQTDGLNGKALKCVGTGYATFTNWLTSGFTSASGIVLINPSSFAAEGGNFITLQHIYLDDNNAIRIIFRITGNFDVHLKSNGIDYSVTSSSTLSINLWYCLGWVFDGSSISLFLNGISFASSTSTASLTNTNQLLGYTTTAGRFSGVCDTIINWNRALSTTEMQKWSNKLFNKKLILKEDFSDEGADGITKNIANWNINSGTWKIDQATADSGTIKKGTKYLQNVTAGIVAIPCTQAYGRWEFDVYKGIDANVLIVGFAEDRNNRTNDNGYQFFIDSNESLNFGKRTNGSGTTLLASAASYISNTTWYRIRITRSILGVFTVYIKGGSFANWTTVSVVGGSGSNPVTDTTYTTSNYFVLDLDAGDRITNIKIYQGIIT